jgi:hypothetical protein
MYDISIEKRSFKATVLLSKYFFFLFLVVLILLGSIRWQRGTDWEPYHDFFVDRKTWIQYNDGTFEISYTILNYIVHCISDSYSLFLFVFTFLVISLKWKTIKCVAVFPSLSLFLYICQNFGDIFAVRQALAISILWVTIIYIQRHEKFKFIAGVLLATSIHNASFFWIFAYYIYHKNLKIFLSLILLIVSLLIGISNGLERLFTMVFDNLSGLEGINIRLLSKILFYTSDTEIMQSSAIRIMINISKRIFVVPIIIFSKRRLEKANEYMPGIINLYIFGNIFNCLFSGTFETFQRLSTAFTFLEIFTFPALLYIIKKKHLKYLFLFIILIYGFLKLLFGINAYRDLFLPYYTIFNPM